MTNCLLFRWPVTVRYSDGDPNSRQLVWYSDHGFNTGPFDDWTYFNHLNARLVGNLDPYCTILCENKLIFQANTHTANTSPDQSWVNPNWTDHISFHK